MKTKIKTNEQTTNKLQKKKKRISGRCDIMI